MDGITEQKIAYILLGVAVGLPIGFLIGLKAKGSGVLFERNSEGNITAILPAGV